MNRRLGALAVVALVLGAGLAGLTAASAGTQPEVSLTIDSSTTDSAAIDGGDTYRTNVNPTLTINASVGDNASAERTLSEVVVRVNGDLQSNVSVSGDQVTESVDLSLETGENTVRVIVSDDRDRANSTTFTVVKDDHPPSVYLTEPYKTIPYSIITDGSTNGSWTTFNGTFLDLSTIERVTIRHRWDDRSDGLSHPLNDSRDAYEKGFQIDDPGEQFRQRIFLGLGTNQLQLSATDRWGNTRIYTFEVSVSDTESPTVSLAPYPTRTTERLVSIAGSVSDDTWIQRAAVNVTYLDGDGTLTFADSTRKAIFRSKEYTVDPNRTGATFNKTFDLEDPGTYRVRVSATDITNKTVNRTFRIERLPEEEPTVAPNIRIGRDRTVVLDSETLLVDGLVFDGQVERLAIETRDPKTGQSVGYHLIHSGAAKRRIDFDRNVTILPRRTKVIVRAIDANGVEHGKTFFVNGSSKETFVGNGSTPAAEENGSSTVVSVTPLRTGQPGVARSTVEVTGADADTTVTIPPEGGEEAVAATRNVTLDRLAVTLAADADFTLSVGLRDLAADSLVAPPETAPAVAVSIEHSIDDERIRSVTFDFQVRRSYLEAHDIDPANLTVYRKSGDWTALETTRTGGNDTHVRYRAVSPGLSAFSVAAPRPAPDEQTTTNGTAPNGTNGTAANGTSDTAPNGTDDTDGQKDATSTGTAQIFVTNVTLNATKVSPGEPLAVNATLTNTGDANGTYVAGMRVWDGENVSLVAKKRIPVPVNATRNVTFVHNFSEAGSYNVSVNGTRAGPITVGGGGLFSFLSIIPVGLIGMGLGGIVGLAIIGVLVRFVLRRVGGGEADG